jgi:hypothetical protein
LEASPLQVKVLSGAPVSSTHGATSTAMNQMFGLALAALIVASPRLKPTVTMMLYFWSTKPWMSLV